MALTTHAVPECGQRNPGKTADMLVWGGRKMGLLIWGSLSNDNIAQEACMCGRGCNTKYQTRKGTGCMHRMHNFPSFCERRWMKKDINKDKYYNYFLLFTCSYYIEQTKVEYLIHDFIARMRKLNKEIILKARIIYLQPMWCLFDEKTQMFLGWTCAFLSIRKPLSSLCSATSA